MKTFQHPEGATDAEKAAVDAVIAHVEQRTAEQIAEATKSVRESLDLTKINNALKEQGETLGKIKGMQPIHVKSAREEFIDAIKSEDFLQSVRGGRKMEVNVKAVGSILNSGNSTAVATVSNTIVPEVQSAPSYPNSLLAAVLKGSVSSETITWVNQKPKDGAVAFTAEGAALPQVDFQWVVETSQAKKIGVFTKISMEMLSDAGLLANTIGSLQSELINIEVENQLVNGTGTGAYIKGASTLGVSYTATALNGVYDAPSYVHAIFAVATQMRNGGFTPTLCFVNPFDEAIINSMQDEIGRFMSAEAKAVLSPIQIVGCAKIASGDFIVIDPTVWMAQSLEGLSVEFGFDSDDFTKDLITVKARMRLHSYVSDVKKNGIVNGDFATIVAALTKVVEEDDSDA